MNLPEATDPFGIKSLITYYLLLAQFKYDKDCAGVKDVRHTVKTVRCYADYEIGFEIEEER